MTHPEPRDPPEVIVRNGTIIIVIGLLGYLAAQLFIRQHHIWEPILSCLSLLVSLGGAVLALAHWKDFRAASQEGSQEAA